MRMLNRIALIAGISVCMSVQAELINFQEAIEASDIRVSASADGVGHVNARSCRTCKAMTLVITPATIISVEGRPMPPGSNISKHWPGGLVIYDVGTKQVVRLDL